MGRTTKVLATAVLASALAVATPSVAAATNSSCMVVFFNKCTTGTIAAHSTGRYVKIYVEAHRPRIRDLEWKVVDADNGIAVGRGKLTAGCTLRKTIKGLYGRYYLRIDVATPGSYANIHNNTTVWPDHEVRC